MPIYYVFHATKPTEKEASSSTGRFLQRFPSFALRQTSPICSRTIYFTYSIYMEWHVVYKTISIVSRVNLSFLRRCYFSLFYARKRRVDRSAQAFLWLLQFFSIYLLPPQQIRRLMAAAMLLELEPPFTTLTPPAFCAFYYYIRPFRYGFLSIFHSNA